MVDLQATVSWFRQEPRRVLWYTEKWYSNTMSDPDRQIDREAAHAELAKEDGLRNTTVEERWNMMWQMTVDAWAKKGVDITKLPMRKDIVRLIRLKDKQ